MDEFFLINKKIRKSQMGGADFLMPQYRGKKKGGYVFW